jgi:hypothetical protein
MWNDFARRHLPAAAFLAAILAFAPAANATTYLATFNGAVTTNALPGDNDFPELFTTGSAQFTVKYSDSLPFGPGHNPGVGFGQYLGTGAIWTVQMGSFTTSATGGTFVVTDGFLNADRFGGSVVDGTTGTINPGLSNGTLSLVAVSFGLGATVPAPGNPSLFNSLDLPTSTFSGYTESALTLSFLFGTGGFESPKFVSAVITDFSIVPLTQAPVPAALPLFASGLGILGWAGRRRRQKQVAA